MRPVKCVTGDEGQLRGGEFAEPRTQRTPASVTGSGTRKMINDNLIERGLAWQERPQDLPVFNDVQREVRKEFETL